MYLLTLNYKENNKENSIINFYSWIFYQEINYNNCLLYDEKNCKVNGKAFTQEVHFLR